MKLTENLKRGLILVDQLLIIENQLYETDVRITILSLNDKDMGTMYEVLKYDDDVFLIDVYSNDARTEMESIKMQSEIEKKYVMHQMDIFTYIKNKIQKYV